MYSYFIPALQLLYLRLIVQLLYPCLTAIISLLYRCYITLPYSYYITTLPLLEYIPALQLLQYITFLQQLYITTLQLCIISLPYSYYIAAVLLLYTPALQLLYHHLTAVTVYPCLRAFPVYHLLTAIVYSHLTAVISLPYSYYSAAVMLLYPPALQLLYHLLTAII